MEQQEKVYFSSRGTNIGDPGPTIHDFFGGFSSSYFVKGSLAKFSTLISRLFFNKATLREKERLKRRAKEELSLEVLSPINPLIIWRATAIRGLLNVRDN